MDVESATQIDLLAQSCAVIAWDGHVIVIQNSPNSIVTFYATKCYQAKGKSGNTSDLNAHFYKYQEDTFSSICTIPIPSNQG